ncbi:DnaB-like helicase C-terminal domain-containing protein [Leptospira interrogans]|nr:DnaB-like helicase C-terminal domain-containing protein [Leptospira interrogans]
MTNIRIPAENSDTIAANLFETQYFKILDDRTKTSKQYSLGFDCLDKLIFKPASMHELTIIAGESGTGKSLFSLAMEIELLKRGTCVVKIFPEMGQARNHDRFLSMITKMVTKNLNKELLGKPDYLKEIKYKISQFRELTNRYYPYDNRNVSVEGLREIFIGAKKYFSEAGALPEDEYMIVFIDLLSLLKDWGTTAPDIEESLAHLNRIMGEFPVHIVGIVQTNEANQRTPKTMHDQYLTVYNIKNSATYKERARDVLIINRPSVIAKRIGLSYTGQDILDVSLVKSNDGELGSAKFLFEHSNGLRISPLTPNTANGVNISK